MTFTQFSNLLRLMNQKEVDHLVVEPVERYGVFPTLEAYPSKKFGWEFATQNRGQWFHPAILHQVIQRTDSPRSSLFRFATDHEST